MAFVLGLTAFAYFGLYPVLYRWVAVGMCGRAVAVGLWLGEGGCGKVVMGETSCEAGRQVAPNALFITAPLLEIITIATPHRSYEPKTYHAQQRLLEAATHQPARSPYPEDAASTAAAGRKKFIVQRQLEGEYDNRLPSYYSRAPEMQMAEVNDRVGSLPDGMLGATVGSTTAERRLPAGTAAVGSRAPRRMAGANVPSMYETQSRIPGLEDSDF